MSIDAGPSFLGSGWSFPPRFRIDGTLEMAHAEQDIRESLIIILSTSPGERVMQPAFGCGLRALVFESVDEGLRTRIKDVVVRAVRQFEHRVEVELVAVHGDGDAINAGVLHIELSYRIRATNTAANLVFPFYPGSSEQPSPGGPP